MILEQGIVFMLVGMSFVICFLLLLVGCIAMVSKIIQYVAPIPTNKSGVTAHPFHDVIADAINQHRHKNS